MNYLFGILVLFSIHLSEQYEIISLEIGQNRFEFEPDQSVLPKFFIPSYIDIYPYNDGHGNILIINLIARFFGSAASIMSFNYGHFIYKQDGDQFVNFTIPWLPTHVNKYAESSLTYYTSFDTIRIPKDSIENSVFQLNNGIQENLSLTEEGDLRDEIVILKLKAPTGENVTFIGKYKPRFMEKVLKKYCCFFKRRGILPYRYKMIRDQVTTPNPS
ncbi:hypothetical protein BdWA1_000712 [Babesia duncani]|uniref:Uncharacterized protein n=1 Tax=Babesia duncani TaxID=323732 RepID=A0AAD9UQ90_9APIC|nr:hypothetical protein BdWA1_000712 [Babesia duncani]